MDKREIRFDGWHVDFASGEISKDGRTQRLQDQPLQILDELTGKAGEVVSREALITRLWPKGVVEFDTGHWVMSDQPQRFNEVVAAWLGR